MVVRCISFIGLLIFGCVLHGCCRFAEIYFVLHGCCHFVDLWLCVAWGFMVLLIIGCVLLGFYRVDDI